MTIRWHCPNCHHGGDVNAHGNHKSMHRAAAREHAKVSPGCKLPDPLPGTQSSMHTAADERRFMEELREKSPERFRIYAQQVISEERVWDVSVNVSMVRAWAQELLDAEARADMAAVGMLRSSSISGRWPQ